MERVLPLFILVMLLTGCNQKYYVVRHAEKAQESGNPPLSDAGQQRALALREQLKNKKIGYIFTTNTFRTQQTAGPTAEFFQLDIQSYGKVDSALIDRFKMLHKNTLIVGHSNTVDELINDLIGKKLLKDLPDQAYDRLFILTKKGKRLTLVESRYGQPSPE